MAISYNKDYNYNAGGLTLSYFVSCEENSHWKDKHSAKLTAQSLGYNGWTPYEMWPESHPSNPILSEEEIRELMWASGMGSPFIHGDKDLLYKAQQDLSGPLWTSVNADGEEENLPPELLKHLEFCEDYEDSLHLERVKNAELNLHRYLAVDHEGRGQTKNIQEEMRWELPTIPAAGAVYIGSILCRDRITDEVEILNEFPSDRRGYALGVSTYGKVYIPEKFRGYIPKAGETMKATIALGDVSLHNGRPKMCRFNLVFIH